LEPLDATLYDISFFVSLVVEVRVFSFFTIWLLRFGVLLMARLAPVTVNKALVCLQQIGLASELTERRRHRLFKHDKFMDMLEGGQ
jgi:hypothetical protein